MVGTLDRINNLADYSLWASLLEVAHKELLPSCSRVITMQGKENFADQLFPFLEVEPVDQGEVLHATMRRLHEGMVTTLPPWGHMKRPEGAGPPEADSHENTVSVSRVGILLPAGELSRVPWRNLPFGLGDAWKPVLVMEGELAQAGGLFGAHVSIRAAFVISEPRSQNNDTAAIFFKIPHVARTDDAGGGAQARRDIVQDFSHLLRRKKGRTKWGYVCQEGQLLDGSWSYERYDPEIREKIDDLAGFGAGGRLSDLFQVVRPRVPRADLQAPAECRVLRGRDLSPDGTIIPAEEGDLTKGESVAHVNLCAGDILMRSIENTAHTPPRPAQVWEADLPLAAGISVLVLRPKGQISQVEMEFYKIYLGSRRAREVLRGSSLRGHLRLSNIAHLPLPVPDQDLLAALGDIELARARLNSWIDESGVLLSETFDSESAADARGALIRQGRLLRQRVESGVLVDSFEHRISRFFPYPIAHRWRVAEVKATESDLRGAYLALLDCFEIHLVYGAVLSMVMARRCGQPLNSMRAIQEKFTRNERGVGVGDWVNVLKEVSSPKFQKLSESTPLIEVRQILPQNGPVADAQVRLSRRRNDESHQRRVEDVDLAEAYQDARQDLLLLLEQGSLLTDLPLIQVKENHWDSLQGRGASSIQVLRGDHPVAPSETLGHVQVGLEIGSLYVKDSFGELHLLRPYLVREACPRCGTWSTFQPDRRVDGKLVLKALDHGHTTDGSKVESALRHVGFL